VWSVESAGGRVKRWMGNIIGFKKMKKKICKLCGKKKTIPQGWTCKTCKRESKPSYWKEKAWELCSEFNRRKDADWQGYVACCTCGEVKHWKDGDAGHFLAGRSNGILFEDKGIHFQCKKCNGPGKGEQYLYSLYMLKRYGQETIDELVKKKNSIVQFSISDYKDLITEYKVKIARL
jgi:hypothetical protein